MPMPPPTPDEYDHSPGLGGGVYNDECEAAMKATAAECVCLMVFNGNRGNGFSVAIHDPAMTQRLPSMLRSMADQIEGVLEKAKGN